MKNTLLTILTLVLISIQFQIIAEAQESSTIGQTETAADAPANTATDSAPKVAPTPQKKKDKKVYSVAIEDNSFLIEEAYNQESGVMQTVSTCLWFRRPQQDVNCTVTQEFPTPNRKHQLSYTMPVSFKDSGRSNGIGDLTLNYRYQLSDENAWALVAPRVSLIVPTGSQSRGFGTGSVGFQFNLPVSKRLSEKFVAHFNAGTTFTPKVRGFDNDGNLVKRNIVSYNAGGSIIWLNTKRFNTMLEYLENISGEIDDFGKVRRFNESIVSPGFRMAFDLGKLQIVPGVAVPRSFNRGSNRTGVFFYLSLEHPFRKITE